mmetsp:Transcript_5965/g.11558  ORF Transcript_5965/g.11558 Transcript_5965/m.11558 type:complete len:1473 (-) Transcript_5965:116-4534(-)|eukprot:CAMPEP_0196144650 /NCGR_PEP_ID=MMETSP0910-20130528/17353_1 /TAXON_ID=49265 /ORGANISM="Thalassiosira rotula, Strain GSO102" /LENGTH=1472 /DNA_ID=CAMNT_0041406363 /DNA_START=427 /DNA_END=4845 /DNA_ORIENTATION=+
MSDPKSMGDLFRERRAAAAAAGRNNAGNTNTNTRQDAQTRTQMKSFAEIQREQQQQQQRQQKQQPRQQQQQQQREQNSVDEFGRLMRPTGSSHGNSRNTNSGSSHQYGNAANTSRRGASNNNSRGGRQNHRANLPIEQGVIHTLLDKFGFILCADREKELFFHYSEFKEGHSDDLNIGDEVEFRLGRAEERGGRRGGGSEDDDKMSAFDVRKLPKGTIYWEKEDEPVGKRWRGCVDQIAREEHQRGQRGGMRDRNSGGKSGAVDGVIRITDGDDNGEKIEIYYAPSDYAPAKTGQNHSRLDRKDVVEFTLVTKRRTGKKYARNITLIQSERERQREEREAKLLEGATLERGKVVSDKGDFGFLRSTTRVEEVYFHISHILSREDGDEKPRGMLKEGQDVEFYVVNESGGGAPSSGDRRGSKKGGKSLSARKIKVLPQGSVKFEHTIAEGVTGTVTECPVASGMEPFGRRDDRRKNDRDGGAVLGNSKIGKIRLQEEIIVDINDGEKEVITHVLLPSDAYPGGTFAISRTGSEVGSWIRPGDVLLFDVVKKVIDGTCRAVPTKFIRRASLRSTEAADAVVDKNDSLSSAKPSVRLIEPSLCGRAEGVIRSIHDNYGFIHLAERSVDAYLPLFEVFPAEIQGDLVRNNPDVYLKDDLIRNKGGRIQVEVGMEVSFDLSLQMLSNASSGGRAGDRGRYGKQSRSSPAAAQEKESLRARRVQILPKGTVKEKIAIAEGVKATVIREDPKQPFVGTLELEKSLKIESGSQRHPLVAKLLDAISEGKYGDEEVTFHDVLSERDAQVVISMVNSRYDGLEWSYAPENNVAGDNCHSRKLCIARKKRDGADEDESEQLITSKTSSDIASMEASDGKEEPPLEGNEDGVENNDEDATAEETAVTGTVADKKQDYKKKSKKAKIVKALRFDKFSFPDMSVGPLGVGDVVTCDIFQSRRTGAAVIENIKVVERKERSPVVVLDREDGRDNAAATQRKRICGFVTEAVPSRQFGFISAVDEQGLKTGEHVFFHFKEVESSATVVGGGDVAQDGSTSLSLARSKKPGRSDLNVIRKGDEVKFNAGPGKNGKLTATNVSILPRGTLKIAMNKTDNKSPSCTGYILMEPSHTSLANTPSHVALQSGTAPASGGGSRWDNVRDDKSMSSKSGSNAKEGGVILLLSDPSHLFSPKQKMKSPKKTAEAPLDNDNDARADTSSGTESNRTESETENNDSDNAEASKDAAVQDAAASAVVGMHVLYRSSSIMANNRRNDGPKRGDLVTFGKTRGAKLVKDIRVEKMGAATSLRGILTDINKEDDTAVFVSSDDNDGRYEIKLAEVVSCDKTLLKDKEQVDGILHEGKIFGVCRTKDIHLASSFGRRPGGSNISGGLKERPKLNLTVKKELQGMGGKIMAQSRMAKGPDGTNGFAPGWTKRVSPHTVVEKEEVEEVEQRVRSLSLSAAASEFVPNFPMIAASGFEMVEDGGME